MRRLFLVFLLAAATLVAPLAVAQPLSPLNIEDGSVTVSGVSSGAFMAHQLHVAHSRLFNGAGMVAGGPFACASGSIWPRLVTATAVCMDLKEDFMPFLGPPSLQASLEATRGALESGEIDDPANLADDRVYLFSGGRDETVPRSVMDVVSAYYARYLDAADIEYVTDIDAGHGLATNDGTVSCGATRAPYLNDCGYDTAGALLNHLHGGDLTRPDRQASEAGLMTFDQAPFVPTGSAPASLSLGDSGFVYVPHACRQGAACRLHVALHGCRQSAQSLGDDFAMLSGYNSWAEANRIVVLYPQARPTASWWPGRSNPRGCWDWWGYTSDRYYGRRAPQIEAIASMVRHIIGEIQ